MLWAHTNLSKSNLSQAYCVSPLILLLTNSIITYDGLHIDRGDYWIVGSFWRLIWANIFLVALWNSIATNVTIYSSENSHNSDSVLGIPHTDVRYYTPWDECLPCYRALMKSHKQIWLCLRTNSHTAWDWALLISLKWHRNTPHYRIYSFKSCFCELFLLYTAPNTDKKSFLYRQSHCESPSSQSSHLLCNK